MNLVHSIYGYGKGKTTAAIGQAIRAAGADYNVCFAQFMKDGDSNEFNVLKNIPNITCLNYGHHELIRMGEQPSLEEKDDAQKLYDLVCEKSKVVWYDILVCDEILTTLFFNMISEEQITNLIKNKKRDLELILTGTMCPPEIINLSDYCHEIKKIKHPYDKGVEARKGIEY